MSSIDNLDEMVLEYIGGLTRSYPSLRCLNGFPQIVLRQDVLNLDEVAIISGGGGGHEPAHAGFVGKGMLTAAVCGNILKPPSVEAILANYTPDRLNFGLAAEEAKCLGYKVEIVFVGDDCALLQPRGEDGRRGLAGTILVHKVAGAAAAAKYSLSFVAAEARRACKMVRTMGVSLSIPTLMGHVALDRSGSVKMELGRGIHGEAGVTVVDHVPVDEVVTHVLRMIMSTVTPDVLFTKGCRVVLLVNGLGAAPIFDLMAISGDAVSELRLEHGIAVDRVYTGSFLTSLDMSGFSISLMKVDDLLLQHLNAPTNAPCWPVRDHENQRPNLPCAQQGP